MSLSEFYEQESSRFLEVLVGIVLSLISLLFWVGIIMIIVRVPFEISIILTILGLIIVAALLSRLSCRLITKRGRADGSLLSPSSIGFGALIFLLGAVLFFYVGYTDSNWRAAASGLGSLLASVYAIRLAIKRVRVNKTN